MKEKLDEATAFARQVDKAILARAMVGSLSALSITYGALGAIRREYGPTEKDKELAFIEENIRGMLVKVTMSIPIEISELVVSAMTGKDVSFDDC